MKRRLRRGLKTCSPNTLMPPSPSLPSVKVREAIAEAVSWIVDEISSTQDGYGKCQMYAGFAMMVASAVTRNTDYRLQCGSVYLHMQADRAFAMVAENDGLERGEFHMWVARPMGKNAEIIDIAARHVRRAAEEFSAIKGPDFVRTREPVPDWLWDTHSNLWKFGYQLVADYSSTVKAQKALCETFNELRPFFDAAVDRSRVNLGEPPRRIYVFEGGGPKYEHKMRLTDDYTEDPAE